MSNATVEQVYVDAFRDNVRHLAQQKTAKLRPYVDEWSPEAQTGAWDRLSKGEMTTKGRKQATPETGRVWSRRIAIASPWDDGEITEVEDPSMTLNDINSNLNQSMGMAAGRKFDDIIIGAAIGNATEIARDNPHTGVHTPSQVALPAAQIVGDGSAAISFDMVTEVQEKFMLNDIDPEVPKIFVVGPRQIRELMNLTENTSADYVQAQALQQYGIVPNWLGFTWIASTRLTSPTGATDGTRACIAMTYDAVGLHVPQDIQAFIQRDPSLSYAWRPYCTMTLGAVRVEDEKVVVADVLDPTNA